MALSREQVGLVFTIGANSQPARDDISAFGQALLQSVQNIERNTERSFRNVGRSAREGTSIARESFITAASEIIEAYGVDGDIANEIAKMLFNAGAKAIVASGVIVGAFVAAGVAIFAAVKAAQGMVDIADKIGTKSKDDFEKVSKAIKDAGGQVTQLDRALSQQLTRAVDQVKGAFDRWLLTLLREAGPELVQLFRDVARAMNTMLPTIQRFGQLLATSLNIANAALTTLVENFGLAKDALANLLSFDPVRIAIGGAQAQAVAALLKVNYDAAKKAADSMTLPDATGFKDKKAKDSHDYQLDLLKEQGRETELMIRREIELAEIAFKEKGLAAKDYEKFATDAEQRILIAKLLTFEAERKQIQSTVKDKTERAVKLQKIENEELAARQNTESAIAKIRKDARDEEKRIAELENKEKEEEFKLRRDRERREIDALRDFLQERNKMLDDLGRARVGTLSAEADTLEGRARTQPRFAEAARQARERARIAELEFQRVMYFAKLNAAEQELLLLTTTEQQKVDIQARFAQIRLEAIRQFQFQRQQIEDQSVKPPSLLEGFFGKGFKTGLDETNSILGGFKGMFGDFAGSLKSALEGMPSLADTAFGAMTQGATAMVEAFIMTGKTGPAALRQLAAGVILAVAKMAAVKAVFNLAEGFANLALAFLGDPKAGAAAVLNFKAAAIYGAVAAIAGAAGRAIAPSTGGEGGGFGGGGGGDNGRRVIEQGDRSRPEHIIIHIRAETEEGVIVRRIVDDYNNNGPTRQTFGKG